jgi:hypothetical protein
MKPPPRGEHADAPIAFPGLLAHDCYAGCPAIGIQWQRPG